MDADLVIMGGLNESVWPSDSSIDPWMSQAMRMRFGLPVSDQQLSLAAHDFVQGLCGGEVVITRSARMGGGPSVASRWLQKLKVIIDIADLDSSDFYDQMALDVVRRKIRSDQELRISRPCPDPVIEARPRRFNVTDIEKLLRDPYAIYADKVLGVRKLPHVFEEQKAALKGTILHEVLEGFIKAYKLKLPDNALSLLMDSADLVFRSYSDDLHLLALWRPQFEDSFRAFLRQETCWREGHRPESVELRGAIQFATDAALYEIVGRADRMDRLIDGAGRSIGAPLAIIDYKTGGSFTKRSIVDLEAPQLALNGLIARRGGYQDLGAAEVFYLGYWYVHNGQKAGTDCSVSSDIDDLMDRMEVRLSDILTHYEGRENGYLSIPNPLFLPRYSDYAHLARVQEWSRYDDASGQSGSGE